MTTQQVNPPTAEPASLDAMLTPAVLDDAADAYDGLHALLPAIHYALDRAEVAMHRMAEGHKGHGLTDDEFDRALDASTWQKLARMLDLVETMAHHAADRRDPDGSIVARIGQLATEYRIAL